MTQITEQGIKISYDLWQCCLRNLKLFSFICLSSPRSKLSAQPLQLKAEHPERFTQDDLIELCELLNKSLIIFLKCEQTKH